MRCHRLGSSVVEKGIPSVLFLSLISISAEIVRKTDKDKESTGTTLSSLNIIVPHLYEHSPLQLSIGGFGSLTSMPFLSYGH